MRATAYDPMDDGAIGVRDLPDGRQLALWPMLLGNTRLTIAVADDYYSTYSDAYCYHDTAAAIIALQTWDGEGDPEGWVRHIGSGRRRPDGTPTNEYVHA